MGTQYCPGYERRAFICDFCDYTGVAHFTLEFWQLNTTDNFLYVCFAMFLVKLHRNYCNTKCS